MNNRKIFVSYKYADSNVQYFNGGNTPRYYVNYLEENHVSGNDIFKGERDNESLAEFKDETIRTHLKDKIRDSSVTIVLISPNMLDLLKNEKDQWIPWEISYSLKKLDGKGENGIVAVVLPDFNGSYNYFINYYTETLTNYESCNFRSLSLNRTFKIIQSNSFNKKNPNYKLTLSGRSIYIGEYSYIDYVKWEDFIESPQMYTEQAIDKSTRINEFNITKII